MLNLSTAADHVAEIVASYSFHDEVTGAHWPVAANADGEPVADHSCAIVYTLDGARWEVRIENCALKGTFSTFTEPGTDWDLGYQAGFADGANDELASRGSAQ